MNKSELKKMLGESIVVSNTANYRVWLDSVLVPGKELKRANRVITLISYWINANDNTYCPVEPEVMEETVKILLKHIAKANDPHKVNKYRYDYDVLGGLKAKYYVGGQIIADTIHLLDLLREEYDGRKCKSCYNKITKSATRCDRCGESADSM